jgi:hypothetical protein
MTESLEELQRRICQTFGAAVEAPLPGTRVGIALQTLDRVPIYGVRIAPTEGMCGWYIHAGEGSNAVDFYQALCVDHLSDYCKFALPFLCLPPGWRFITDGKGYIDAWKEADAIPGGPGR